ncbi:MAG: hypothetical protein ABIS67_14295, partial [Candidatus Eisenbacteria bacterium]
MSHRPLAPLLISGACLLTACATARPAIAHVDTLEVWTGTMGVPVIASVPLGPLAPPYGVVHIGYTRNSQLRHAWKDFGAWQFEAVADSASAYDIAVRSDGLASMALADRSRRLIFAERTPGGWVLDTLGTYPGIEMRVSLALAPDASPAIAFVVAGPGSVNSLRYARRSGAGWT